MEFKVQKIRFCTQCREILPLKCVKCVHHPERRPTVQELFDWPPILQTRDCGCVQFACQRPGCQKTLWRHVPTRGQGGKAKFAHQFCSLKCSAMVTNSAKNKQQKVPCVNCGTIITRHAFALRQRRFSACSHACRNIYQARLRHAEKERAEESRQRGATLAARLQSFWCERCRAVTDQLPVSYNKLECTVCSKRSRSVVRVGDAEGVSA